MTELIKTFVERYTHTHRLYQWKMNKFFMKQWCALLWNRKRAMYKGDSADRGTLMMLAVERAIQGEKTIQMANFESKESFFSMVGIFSHFLLFLIEA